MPNPQPTALLLMALALLCASCGQKPAPQASANREPNLVVQKQARELAKEDPRSVTIQFEVADGSGPTPSIPDNVVKVTSQTEIDEILRAFENSDHDPAKGEPVGMGKDNLMDLTFYGAGPLPIGAFSVLTPDIDARWGPSVKGVLIRYLPKAMKLTPDTLLVPK